MLMPKLRINLMTFFPGIDKFYYMSALSACDYREAIKWILGPIATLATKTDQRIWRVCCAPDLREFVDALTGGKFPRHFAKEIFDRVLGQEQLSDIIVDPKYAPIDITLVEKAVAAALAMYPDKLQEAKSNPKLVQWFVGQTLKANKGMSPTLVKETLLCQLST
jgi:Asp-tRNA(Asn)/Glu-tRNA(Gln) amidotransferase B subunit